MPNRTLSWAVFFLFVIYTSICTSTNSPTNSPANSLTNASTNTFTGLSMDTRSSNPDPSLADGVPALWADWSIFTKPTNSSSYQRFHIKSWFLRIFKPYSLLDGWQDTALLFVNDLHRSQMSAGSPSLPGTEFTMSVSQPVAHMIFERIFRPIIIDGNIHSPQSPFSITNVLRVKFQFSDIIGVRLSIWVSMQDQQTALLAQNALARHAQVSLVTLPDVFDMQVVQTAEDFTWTIALKALTGNLVVPIAGAEDIESPVPFLLWFHPSALQAAGFIGVCQRNGPKSTAIANHAEIRILHASKYPADLFNYTKLAFTTISNLQDKFQFATDFVSWGLSSPNSFELVYRTPVEEASITEEEIALMFGINLIHNYIVNWTLPHNSTKGRPSQGIRARHSWKLLHTLTETFHSKAFSSISEFIRLSQDIWSPDSLLENNVDTGVARSCMERIDQVTIISTALPFSLVSSKQAFMLLSMTSLLMFGENADLDYVIAISLERDGATDSRSFLKYSWTLKGHNVVGLEQFRLAFYLFVRTIGIEALPNCTQIFLAKRLPKKSKCINSKLKPFEYFQAKSIELLKISVSQITIKIEAPPSTTEVYPIPKVPEHYSLGFSSTWIYYIGTCWSVSRAQLDHPPVSSEMEHLQSKDSTDALSSQPEQYMMRSIFDLNRILFQPETETMHRHVLRKLGSKPITMAHVEFFGYSKAYNITFSLDSMPQSQLNAIWRLFAISVLTVGQQILGSDLKVVSYVLTSQIASYDVWLERITQSATEAACQRFVEFMTSVDKAFSGIKLIDIPNYLKSSAISNKESVPVELSQDLNLYLI